MSELGNPEKKTRPKQGRVGKAPQATCWGSARRNYTTTRNRGRPCVWIWDRIAVLVSRDLVIFVWPRGSLHPVTELDYDEIIALSEDPNVSFDDVRGRPFTPDELRELAEFADSIFYECPLDVQVRNVIGMPVHISVRRFARMSGEERAEILSQLPVGLANEILEHLPAGGS